MRLILLALLVVGALALVLALSAWLAERRIECAAARWSSVDIAHVPIVDVALVLGTAPIGPEGGPNRYFVHRLDTAAALWKAGKAKFLIVSGNRTDGRYDGPTAMRSGLIERGVPPEAIYRDSEGYRTRESVLRARDVYGQARLLIVSQRFHLGRALCIAHRAGLEACGVEAHDVGTPYSVFTELRRFPSALVALVEAWTAAPAHRAALPIAIAIDPAN